ncbi:N-acetylmuramoyl-L-alanine amidase family protein [Mucilaginibacter sp. X4EP1]|jgi:N-acetylmuramoyl-L-alanine amidase|uniref:N-acetylmuramoyl-L-alanine amidase family protein n=1 Tax=Mucilaginibacter sp. X4EP1 TaxID=2723092 RepID=UPI0021697A26|nr:N-acetylmuramoyl-L-alanine amidase [Mucilaginibacter sp. X4EP1]MCS3814579.1 N-acetylmuramoyl-L-alanine amidase [Mucilaginibacter sp. X4EP1]
MKNKALKRLIYGLLIIVGSLPSFSFASGNSLQTDTVTGTGYKIKTIIVDPGHGGRPSGTTGTYSHGASGSFSTERSVTLALAFKLQAELEKQLSTVKVVLTRTTEDDVSLQRRAEIANENKGDLFISLHCNSLPNRGVREVVGHKHHKAIYKTIEVADHSGRGVLILVYGFHRTKEEENAIKQNLIEGGDSSEFDTNPDPNDPASMILMNEYKRKYRKQSIHLAELLVTEFGADGRKIEGIREQGVHVLCHSAMPAVLVETGYIDNADDEAYLNSEQGQNEIVASIVRAVQSYKNEVEGVTVTQPQ